MPIKFNQTVGKNTNVTIVEFGVGDILITNGFETENHNKKCMVFAQHIAKPTEEWNTDVELLDENKERTTDAFTEQVIMYFSNIKSINNVIHRLEMVKADLLSIEQ